MDEEDKPLTKKEKRALARERKRKERETAARESNLKKWGGIVIALLAVGIIGYFFVNWLRTPSSQKSSTAIETVENDHVKGDSDAPVTLIEYADFQCPACAGFSDAVKDLSENNPDSFRVVFRHMPLASIHSNAISSSVAAEAAGSQDKFWQMHDKLFETQEDWSNEQNPEDKYRQYAQELGLDETKFAEDLESDEVKDRVKASTASGNSLGVTATPTFFLNGKRMTFQSTDQFVSQVEDEIHNLSIE